MKLEIYESKISQMGFADLKAMKELQEDNFSEMIRGAELDEDKIGFFEELTAFNQIIDKVILNKLANIQESNISI